MGCILQIQLLWSEGLCFPSVSIFLTLMDEIKPLHLYSATNGPFQCQETSITCSMTCCSLIRIDMFSPGVNTKGKEGLGSGVDSGEGNKSSLTWWRKQTQSDLWLCLCAGWWPRCQSLLRQRRGHDRLPAMAPDQDLLAGVHPGAVLGKCNHHTMTCHSGPQTLSRKG